MRQSQQTGETRVARVTERPFSNIFGARLRINDLVNWTSPINLPGLLGTLLGSHS